MREEVLEILADLRPDVDFEKEEKIIDDGILDSFDIIATVKEFNDTFDIDITVDELVPENFNTVDNMVELIERLQNEG